MTHLRKPHSDLELTPEELRKLGYSVIDAMIDHYYSMDDKPITTTRSRTELEALLREPIPTTPTAPDQVLQQAIRDVFGNNMITEHPRFFAFIPGPSNAVSAIADMLVSGYNTFAGTWLEGSGAAMIEMLVIDWLCELMGFSPQSGGILTSGGSIANLMALHAARHHQLGTNDTDGVIYYSDQTHSSIDRAVRVVGFLDDQVRRLPSTPDYKIDMDALRAAIAEDRAAGRKPFCVVANAGTTNTGTIDPLPEIADLCAAEDLWMHVDGAYGAAAILTERGKLLLNGIERADSITFDPHKWLFQPYEVGCLMVKDRRDLRGAFYLVPEYLKDTERDESEPNFYDYGIQLTRGFRGLKLWMSLKVFGLDAFREAVEWGFEQAELAETIMAENPRWEIFTHAHMGIINFRYIPEAPRTPEQLDAIQQEIANGIVRSGYAMVATTVLKERKVLRLALINPRTMEEEIEETIVRMAAIGAEL